MIKTGYVIVNFGGPRTLKEVEPFLRELLTDKEVIRTNLPQAFHNLIFTRTARKRAKSITQDYMKIGGGSPIWGDTEYIADSLRCKLKEPVLTFHRYLAATHKPFIEQLTSLDCDEIKVFPMFPQFTYATTGSVALFFHNHLPPAKVQQLRWVKSYPSHTAYVAAMQNSIRDFLLNRGLAEEEVCLLFSAHGLPKIFIDTGDLYEYECRRSYSSIMNGFPKSASILCYQSKFGRGEWLRPYTADLCADMKNYCQDRKYCVFVPLSFTSDHIETLFEIEEQYMPLIKEQGLRAFRVPALNRRPDWLSAIVQILAEASPCTNSMLIRTR